MLWKGVVSFSEDFMIQEKILNPKNRHVDQQRLKYAIQKSMPKLLQNEGFADEIMFNESDDEPNFENAIHALPSKAAINKFKNLIAKEKLNKQPIQPVNSVRERKLAILLDKKGEI